MIARFVDLQIKPEHLDRAKVLLEEVAPKVRAMKGCNFLEILTDIHQIGHFTTYSYWDSEDDLNQYRDSETFKSFWDEIKPLFEQSARAWSSVFLFSSPRNVNY